MAKNNFIHNAFIAGEATPKFFGRTETNQYNVACEDITNMLVYPQGGGGRRPGTIFVGDILRPGDADTQYDGDPVEDARLIPFFASDGTRWQIVITPFAPDSQYVSQLNRPSEWRAINVGEESIEPIYHQTGYSGLSEIMPNYYNLGQKNIPLKQLQYAQSGDVVIVVHGKIRPFAIYYNSNAAPGFRFTMKPYPDPQEAYLGGSNTKDQWTQMPFLAPVTGPSSGVNGINLIVNGSGVITLGVPGGSTIQFDPNWVGKYMKFEKTTGGAGAVVVMITGYNSSTSLNAWQIGGIGPAFSTTTTYGTSAGAFWSDSAWDETKGWPRTVCFFEQRLVFGGSPTFPDYMWFSLVGNIKRMSGFNGGSWKLVTDADYANPVTTADAFFGTLASNVLNEIRWMNPSKTISVGTNYREFIVRGASEAKTIGVDNYSASAETPHGSAYVQAVRIENTAAFLQRTRRQIREMVFSNDEQSFKASNLNIIGEHMAVKSAYKAEEDTRKGVFTQIVMQEAPNGIMWALDSNGSLCAMTRERQQNVTAWHSHDIAGDSKTYDEDDNLINYRPVVKSLSVIQRPQPQDDPESPEPDDLWLTVARSVPYLDGSDIKYQIRTYIERLSPEWENKTIEDLWSADPSLFGPPVAPVYMDCARVTSQSMEEGTWGEAYGVIGHLPHGVGMKVAVVCNGKWFGEYTVGNDGKINISDKLDADNNEYWQAIVGFNYIGQIIPMCPEVPANQGSSQGQPRRIDQITIHFYRSIGARFGRVKETDQESTPVDDLEEIPFQPGPNQNDPIPMFTGEKRVDFPQGYEAKPRVVIQSHIPLPMQVTHIVSRMVVYE